MHLAQLVAGWAALNQKGLLGEETKKMFLIPTDIILGFKVFLDISAYHIPKLRGQVKGRNILWSKYLKYHTNNAFLALSQSPSR